MNDFDAIDGEIQARREARVKAGLLSAPARSPEEAARANRIADRTGTPFGVVAANLPEFQEQEESDGILSASRDLPELGDFMSDSRRASLAKDDVGNLTKLGLSIRNTFRSARDYGVGSAFLTWSDHLADWKNVGGGQHGIRARPDPNFLEEAVRAGIGGWYRGQGYAAVALDAATPEALRVPYQHPAESAESMLAGTVAASNEQAEAVERTSAATDAQFQNIAKANESDSVWEALGLVAKSPRALGVVTSQSLGMGAPGLALTAATAGTSRIATAAAAGASSGATEFGASVSEVLEETGIDVTDPVALRNALQQPALMAKARDRAAKRGLAIGLFDAVTAGIAGHFIINARRGVASAAVRTAAEVAVQTAGGAAGEAAAQLLTDGKLSYGDVIVEGVAGLPFSAIEARANYQTARNRGQVRWVNEQIDTIVQSTDGVEKVRAIGELARETKLGDRSPEDLRAFTRDIAGDGHVYISADEARILFQSQMPLLADVVGGQGNLTEQLASGDIAIPVEQYVARVARLPNAAEIERHARLESDGLSAVELERLDIDGIASEIAGEDDGSAARADSRQRVQDDVYAKLAATQRFSEAGAEAQAKLWAAAFSRFGEASGQDAAQLYERYMGGISNADAPEAGSMFQRGLAAIRGLFNGADPIPQLEPLTVTATTARGAFTLTDAIPTNPQETSEFGQMREVIARDGDTEIGRLLYGNDGTPPTIEVSPEYRRRGVATAMLKLARQQGGMLGDAETGVSGRTRPGYRTDDGQAFRIGADESTVSLAPARLFQSPSDAPRGQIRISPDRSMRIDLFAGADRSTFLHESAHFFLEVFRDITSQQDATPQAQADMQSLLAWFGVDSPDQIGVDQHEQFARGFEQYLGEGKAPSPELQSVFAQFRAWVLGVYRSLTALNVELNDDVRRVFDRMLASDEEIEAAQIRQGMESLFPEAPPAGLTPKQLSDYASDLAAASEEAKAELTAKLVRAEARERQAWWKEESVTVRAEVEAELEATPVFRAARILGGATELADGTPVPEDMRIRLDKAGLVAMGAELKPLAGLYRVSDGVSPQDAAMILGFESAEAMVSQLAGRGNLRQRIDQETDARMRQRHGDPMIDGTLPDEAMQAVHNNRRIRLMERELGLLSDLAGRPRPNLRELKAVATKLIGAKTAREIRPNDYLSAERKAAREATVAAGRGDYADALTAKRRQALNAAMYRAARDAQIDFEKHARYLRRFTTGEARSRLGKAGGDYLDQVDALLEGMELRQASGAAVARRQRLAEWVERQEAAGNPINVPQKLLDETGLTNVRDMTMDDLQGVVDTIKQIEHLARLKNKLILAGVERDRAEVDAEMAQSVAESFESITERTGDERIRERISRQIDDLDVQRLLPSNIARELDGYREGGAVWRNTIQPIRDAIYGRVNPAQQEMSEAVAAIYQKHYTREELSRVDDAVYRPEVGDSWSKGRILSLAMNWGSEGNREAILTQAHSRITETQAVALLRTLDARDFAFVQDMVDQVNSYWPQIADTQRRRTGLVPPRVEPQPYTITTADGQGITVRGGYFPLKYDADRSGYGKTREELDDVYNDLRVGRTARAATKNGHTIERVGSGGATVRLGLDVPQSHMRDVIRDINLGDAVAYVHNTIHGFEFTEAVIAAGKRSHLQALDLWLKDVAAGEIGAKNAIEEVTKFARQNTTAAVLAWKASTSLLQFTGVVQTGSVIGNRNMLRGLARLTSKSWIGPNSIWNDIRDKSEYMKERFGKVPDAVQAVSDARDGRFKAGHAALIRWGYVPMSRVQMIADATTWLAGELHGLKLFDGDVARARQYADDLVIRAQSPENFIDKPAIARGTLDEKHRQSELVKATTMLLSYMIAKGNIAREKYQQTEFTKPTQVVKFTADMIQLFAVEQMILALVTNGLPDDEDDDGWLDDWLAWIGKEVVLGGAATIPLLSQAATEGRGYTAQGVMERSWSTADAAAGAWMDGELDRRDVKWTINAAGIATGIPSSAINTTGDALWRVRDGEDVSPIEFLIRPEKPRD